MGVKQDGQPAGLALLLGPESSSTSLGTRQEEEANVRACACHVLNLTQDEEEVVSLADVDIYELLGTLAEAHATEASSGTGASVVDTRPGRLGPSAVDVDQASRAGQLSIARTQPGTIIAESLVRLPGPRHASTGWHGVGRASVLITELTTP